MSAITNFPKRLSDIRYYLPLGSPTSGTALIGHMPAGDGATQVKLRDVLLERGLSVCEFGATGDGVTDDTAAIRLAHTAASEQGRPLVFPVGTYNVTGAFDIDATQTQWVGVNAEIHWTAAPATYAISLYSSADYAGVRENSHPVLSGLRITGGAQTSEYAATGVRIGHATNLNTSLLSVESCSIDGFSLPVEFIQNAWKVHFLNSQVRWGTGISAAASLANFGEAITFVNCFIVDMTEVNLASGEWHFIGCSFDNTTIRVTGDCGVYLTNCHLENPGSSASNLRYVSLEHASALCALANVQVLLNDPVTSDYESALFYCDAACVNQGLFLRNIKLFSHPWYTPEVNDSHRVLVAGTGRVQFDGFFSWDSGYNFAIAKANSVTYNSDFELGAATGWTTAGTATVSADNTTQKEGTWSLKIACAAGQSGTVTQRFMVKPGAFIVYHAWRKLTINSGTGNCHTRIRFYLQDGVTQIGTGYLFAQRTATTDWGATGSLACDGMIVPEGAVIGELELYASAAAASSADAWFDYCLVNVC